MLSKFIQICKLICAVFAFSFRCNLIAIRFLHLYDCFVISCSSVHDSLFRSLKRLVAEGTKVGRWLVPLGVFIILDVRRQLVTLE